MKHFLPLLLSLPLLAAEPLVTTYPFEGDERVLEVRCGDGTQTAVIAQKVPDGFVLGIDPSEGEIRRAVATYDLEFFANIAFRAETPDQLVYTDYFDLVVADEEARDSLPELARVLRPGGQLLLTLPVANALEETIAEALASPKWSPFVVNPQKIRHLASAEEYGQLIREAGFCPQQAELLEAVETFDERGQLVEWIALQLRDQLLLPPDAHEALAGEIADLYLVESSGPTIEVIRPTLHLQATKETS